MHLDRAVHRRRIRQEQYNDSCMDEDLADDPSNQEARGIFALRLRAVMGPLPNQRPAGCGKPAGGPVIQTNDLERFKLWDASMKAEGFKFSFLRTSGQLEFREKWPGLSMSMQQEACVGVGADAVATHGFDFSALFCKYQDQAEPLRSLEHLECDTTELNVGSVGGELWARMRAANGGNSVSRRRW
ncbi:hypothetical protein F5Y14DRAFT_453760 [Nemania sp. NC0429]|nr:hypothetical protein F5Y14DRAFT_453760 [Nemania sp. NC0429]